MKKIINDGLHHITIVIMVLTTCLFSISSCVEDEPEDTRIPLIELSGIDDNALMSLEWKEANTFIEMIISDNRGMSDYLINIDSLGQEVYTYEVNQLDYKLMHEVIAVDHLTTNFTYDISISLNDINGNTNQMDFQLLLTAFKKFNYLGLVGNGSPAGWNPQASSTMTQSPSDEAIFTYQGPLFAGEIKIAGFIGDWCDGEWLFASQAAKSISEPDQFVVGVCSSPDNKWMISPENAGNYLVTVNLQGGTISFDKQ
ncbi:SusF/SusE family outer membrane protein [Echinicola marina]|uniref:hypothetical protein n=1 Tax=Echinicola marina TaxID=2859768 RepID=UPI001CF6FD0A|nr:hypothetical protein [Echinicola marina]UCS94905.1 SusF/SusE family outer membrane protein [Echinicola marina]